MYGKCCVAIFFEIQKGEGIMEKGTNIVLPVAVITMNGRETKTSYMEKILFKSMSINKEMYMLSPTHIKAMKKLPF